MYIYNTTFMILPGKEKALLELLAPAVSLCQDRGLNPRVSVMREAAGKPAPSDEPSSIAFQMEFHSLESLHKWEGLEGAELSERFIRTFAPEAMVFSSVFETLDI